MWDYSERNNIASRGEFRLIFVSCIVVPELIVLVIPEMREKIYFWIFELNSYEKLLLITRTHLLIRKFTG